MEGHIEEPILTKINCSSLSVKPCRRTSKVVSGQIGPQPRLHQQDNAAESGLLGPSAARQMSTTVVYTSSGWLIRRTFPRQHGRRSRPLPKALITKSEADSVNGLATSEILEAPTTSVQ
jgi:hypothetical protein